MGDNDPPLLLFESFCARCGSLIGVKDFGFRCHKPSESPLFGPFNRLFEALPILIGPLNLCEVRKPGADFGV